jgi:hypothetical protein
MPSAKALGKRKMTAEQIQVYYAKHRRIERKEPDSDDELPSLHDQRIAMIRANQRNMGNIGVVIGNAPPQGGLHVPASPIAPTEPVEVHPDDEHARDLLEALNRPIEGDVITDKLDEILFSDDVDLYDEFVE